jgi:hypothetical protein
MLVVKPNDIALGTGLDPFRILNESAPGLAINNRDNPLGTTRLHQRDGDESC